jgi:hypothetical protein
MTAWCDESNPRGWCDEEISDYFDTNPDLTLAALARMTGRTVPELQQILMKGAS